MNHREEYHPNLNSDLKYAIENGIIDMSHVQQMVEMNRRKELLKKHPFSIWQGRDGYWRTYFPTETGRCMKKRSSRDGIEDLVAEFWKEKDDNPTVRMIFNEWNDRRLELNKISGATHYRNETCFNRHYDVFGDRKIRSVDLADFQDFLEEQIPRFRMTAKAFSNLKTITRGILRTAEKRGLIAWSSLQMFSGLDISKSNYSCNASLDKKQVFDVRETVLLQKYLVKNQDIINLGLLLLFGTGMRVGELAALKPEDIESDCITVQRTESRRRVDGKFEYFVKESPKTEAGIRSIVIPTCYEWVVRNIAQKNPFGEWVFMKDGARVKEKVFENRLWRICKKIGIEPKSPHKIRKTYGTILLDGRIDKNMIIKQMGHSDIMTSEAHYHYDRKEKEKKRELLDQLPDLSPDYFDSIFDYLPESGHEKSPKIRAFPIAGGGLERPTRMLKML